MNLKIHLPIFTVELTIKEGHRVCVANASHIVNFQSTQKLKLVLPGLQLGSLETPGQVSSVGTPNTYVKSKKDNER